MADSTGKPDSSPPELPRPTGAEVTPPAGEVSAAGPPGIQIRGGAEVSPPAGAEGKLPPGSAVDPSYAGKSGPVALPAPRNRAPGGPLVFPDGRPLPKPRRPDEPMGAGALIGMVVGVAVLIALGVGIFVKRHKKPVPVPTPVAVASPEPSRNDAPAPDPSTTPEESPGPPGELPPRLAAKLAELAHRSPYRQLRELEKLNSTPDMVPPGVKERVARWISDLHTAEDPLDPIRAQICKAAGARDDRGVFSAVNNFTQTFQKCCPPALVPGYKAHIGILQELPKCIEEIAGNHALFHNISDKATYLAKGFSADEALSDCAKLEKKDERLLLGAAVIASVNGLVLPAALTPQDWLPVEAMLDELGLERPALGQ